MKRHLIALAVLAATVTPLTAQANPKVYGQINLSAESYKRDFDGTAKDEEYTRMLSNASRFGVRGNAELTATLSTIYGIEWQVNADGEGTDLGQRNRFVGLKHQDLGTIRMGKYDTYLKLAQGRTDLFNDFAADMEFTIAGENRINNVLAYESPKFMNTQLNIMSQTQDVATGSKAGSSVSIVHQNDDLGLYVALASDMGIDGKSALFGNRESDTMRLVASYKIADLTLNAIYSTSEQINGKNAETAYLLGGAYKMGDVVLKAQYSMAEADDTAPIAAAGSVEKTQATFGADYNISSKTRAFAWYTMQEDTKKAAVNNVEINILALGIETKF